MIKIELPLFVMLGKTRHHINLNKYHTWHPHLRNKIKQTYQGLIWGQLLQLKFTKPIQLKFVLHRGDRRVVDRSNALCLHEKFVCDALRGAGAIKDDNDKHIDETIFRTGEISKGNPRVDLFITPLEG